MPLLTPARYLTQQIKKGAAKIVAAPFAVFGMVASAVFAYSAKKRGPRVHFNCRIRSDFFITPVVAANRLIGGGRSATSFWRDCRDHSWWSVLRCVRCIFFVNWSAVFCPPRNDTDASGFHPSDWFCVAVPSFCCGIPKTFSGTIRVSGQRPEFWHES